MPTLATLIAIRELDDAHTGENIAEYVYDVVKEYGIENKLGYVMMDNTTNNDTALESLNKRICADGGIGFDPVERRLWCFGHIMNLAVKDLLFGRKKKKKLEGVEHMTQEEKKKEEQRRWHALGAVGKAYKICKEVRSKPQHQVSYLSQSVKDL